MDFFDLVTEVIDLRSFSNLWYWIVLAILWSSMTNWTLGVPYYVVARARRGDEKAARDMVALVRINSERLLTVSDQSAPVMLAVSAFIATGLAMMGWVYGLEFCQALFLLLFPALLVGWLTILTARKMRDEDYADVARALRTHRIIVQMLGVVFIFITAFWGMFTNVAVGPLG